MVLAVNPMNIAKSDEGSGVYGASSIMKGIELKKYTSEGSIWFQPVSITKNVIRKTQFLIPSARRLLLDFTLLLVLQQ